MKEKTEGMLFWAKHGQRYPEAPQQMPEMSNNQKQPISNCNSSSTNAPVQ
jgi:hypothetical protein